MTREGLGDIREMVAGYDFATVVAAYAHGYEDGKSGLPNAALRWLRGEYTTKTEARRDLGVRTILDDASFYDGLRLLAKFVCVAGFGGMIICLDELPAVGMENPLRPRAFQGGGSHDIRRSPPLHGIRRQQAHRAVARRPADDRRAGREDHGGP